MAAFTSLRLTSGLAVLDAHRRKVRVSQAAFALGGGIWSMHFVGMLSVSVGVPLYYDPLPTLGSALIAVLLTGSALMSLHFGRRTETRIVFAGCITGAGIVSMHYLGMSAISGDCIVSYDSGGVMLATGIAIASCILAMHLAYGKRSLATIIIGSVVLGLSIAAMHYSAMLFTSFSRAATVTITAGEAMSSNNLAMIVALSAFVICGIFLLVVVPGDRKAEIEAAQAGTMAEEGPPAAAVSVRQAPLAPLSRASEKLSTARQESARQDKSQPSPEGGVRIPYERDKTLRYLPAQSILFVQADGHYCRIANETENLFCPWSISRVEKSLASEDFVRTHRSYLVNRRYINGFKRLGDKGVCIVGTGEEKEVPVARGRIPEIQQLLTA